MYRGDLGFWNSRTFLVRTFLVRTFLVRTFSKQENLRDSYCNLSTEEAMQISKKWLKQMAQPFTREDQVNLPEFRPSYPTMTPAALHLVFVSFKYCELIWLNVKNSRIYVPMVYKST